VWSTDWFKDRAGQVDRIMELVDAARQQAREEAARKERHAEALAGEATPAGVEPPPATPLAEAYERPNAMPYTFAGDEARYAGRELIGEPPSTLARAVADVVEVESPVHVDEVITRVASMWGTRAGTRIQARIVDAFTLAERQHLVERRGDFLWNPGQEVVVRSRAGTRMSAEHIAPEEYRAAIRMVLATGRGFARPALVTEVRALLGFARTGAALDDAIGLALDTMLADGILGEGSTGVRLR